VTSADQPKITRFTGGMEIKLAAGSKVGDGVGQLEACWDPMNELLDLVVHERYVVIRGCEFGAGRSVIARKDLGTGCTSG
jgi:hypothetical protein